MYRDLAIVQFFLALRVGEAAGIQLNNIDLESSSILIKEIAVWGKNKKFEGLKGLPKNGEVRTCSLNKTLIEVINRRLLDKKEGCEFLFHINGKALGYRAIQYQYNKALKTAGLSDRFSSTHFLRHAMATLTRKHCGSLEIVQAVTGHKDQRLVQHYAQFAPDENQRKAVEVIDEKLNFKRLYVKEGREG